MSEDESLSTIIARAVGEAIAPVIEAEQAKLDALTSRVTALEGTKHGVTIGLGRLESGLESQLLAALRAELAKTGT